MKASSVCPSVTTRLQSRLKSAGSWVGGVYGVTLTKISSLPFLLNYLFRRKGVFLYGLCCFQVLFRESLDALLELIVLGFCLDVISVWKWVLLLTLDLLQLVFVKILELVRRFVSGQLGLGHVEGRGRLSRRRGLQLVRSEAFHALEHTLVKLLLLKVLGGG